MSCAANFADLKTSAANHDARADRLADRLHADNREKHQLRAIAINSSNLGIKVLLWEDAERLAVPLVAGIKAKIGDTHAFYVGVSKLKKGSCGYVRETIACMVDETRNPVIFPVNEECQRFTVKQVFDV